MKVDRASLLQSLSFASAGLSTRELLEQSSCFVFKDSNIYTYNDEVSCRVPSGLEAGVVGAVSAKQLLALLNKMSEESVAIEVTESEFLIRGNGRTAGLRLEKDILLPIDQVERPGKKDWKILPEEFPAAIEMVRSSVGTDESKFSLTCVHVTSDHVEACDGYQLTRYKVKTGVTSPFLVRGSAVKHVVGSLAVKFSETSSWVHFKGSGGVISCRRYVEAYPDLNKLLVVKGDPVSLPKGIMEEVEKAEIFSVENLDDNQVTVQLSPGKLRIRAEGAVGWYAANKKVTYQGKAMSFRITPQILADIANRHPDCVVSGEKLKVEGGVYEYVTCLTAGDQEA